VRVHERGNTAGLSRAHTLVVSASGLVTITGGKWTTYRSMGEEAVNAAARAAGLPVRPSRTKDLRLHGWSDAIRDGSGSQGYGSDSLRLHALMQESAEANKPLHSHLPYRAGEVVWAVREEMARTVEDVLARRTRALLLDARASVEISDAVASLIAKELGRDERWEKDQVSAFRSLAGGYLPRQGTV
ncbi:MAG: FAD-dependent oxidoreductase, partial [Verrucomicrobia bacterium]